MSPRPRVGQPANWQGPWVADAKLRRRSRRSSGVLARETNLPSVEDPDVRVLAVEDDPASRELIVELLGSVAEVTTVPSGEAALEELRRGGYAVVLLDVGLPGIDGFETARLMKKDAATRHTPVIFLTGQIGEQQVRRGYALGAADYLLKPFDPEILRAKVKVFVDLERLRRKTEALSHRVLHDQLTGLPNRTLFYDRLEQALSRLLRAPGLVAVLFLDLNGFKSINDEVGHHAGDRLLIEFAASLQQSIRVSDTAARFGGDEFLVLLEGLSDRHEVEQLTGRIARALDTRCRIGSREVRVSAAAGIAISDDPHADPSALVRAADESMLRHKMSRPVPEDSRRRPVQEAPPVSR
jgi:diguanylate cyclase (GGDEF)-like protein